MRHFPILLAAIFLFSLPLSADKPSSAKSSLNSFLSDYGIPLAAEGVLEASGKMLEPVKNALAVGVCGTGPAFYACWLASGLIDLQRYNIQSGLSKHLEDQVSSFSQSTYNSLFAPEKPKGANSAALKMEELRRVTTRAQSMESIKARITLAQIKPIFDSLFSLTSYHMRKNSPESLEKAARLVAYSAVLLAAYAPEYSGDEPEVSSAIKPLLLNPPAGFRSTTEKEIANLLSQEALSDSSVNRRVQSILCAWFTTKDGHQNICEIFGEDEALGDNNLGKVDTLTWAGLVAPTLFFNIFPQQNDLATVLARTTLNSVAQNFGEAATRVDATDFFANVRRKVQRLGLPQEKQLFKDSQSYETLRKRQFKASREWSELGLRMRANLLRYLALIIPTFSEASLLQSEGKHKEADATLASLFAYIRQYDPEYAVDNVYLRTAAYSILQPSTFKNVSLLSDQLSRFDSGYRESTQVQDFYNQMFASLQSPLTQSNVTKLTYSRVPWLSGGLSIAADLTNVILLKSVVKLASGYSAPIRIMAKEAYSRFGGLIVRGIGEPAKEDIQQAIASNERTVTEDDLVSGSVEMNGRAGGDAQRARAIFERIEPVLFHLFSEAREEYQRGDHNAAARLIAYSVVFLAHYYPEVPSDDSLVSGIAQARFSQFFDKSLTTEFSVLIAKHIGYYDSLDPVLACQIGTRLNGFGLSATNLIWEVCDTQIQKNDSLSSQFLAATKTFGYYAGVAGAMMLPAVAALKTPRHIKIAGAPASLNFAASCVVLGTVGLTVRSIFNGITSSLTSNTKSWAQRWSQYPRTTHRVDENENWGRTQNYFGNIQWSLQQYLSPSAQEGRKDLLLVAQNIAQSLRNAKVAASFGEDDQFHLKSIENLLDEHYSEGKHIYNSLLQDMKYAFFGEIRNATTPPNEIGSPHRDEL